MCQYFAEDTLLLPRPDPQWADLVRTMERRLGLAAPEGPDTIAELFADLSHLGLQFPLKNPSGRGRRRTKPAKFIPWYQRRRQ